MRRTLPLLFVLLLGLALAGCGGCKSKEAEAEALAFLPWEPRGVVHVPDLVRVGETVAALEKTRLAELAAATYGARDTEAIVRPLVAQLGFDPRKPDGFVAAGIEGRRGLAVGQDEQGAQLLVIGVADASRFDGYVAGLARKLGGTARAQTRWAPQEGGPEVEVTTFSAPDGSVRVAFATRGGYAVVASDGGAVEAVGRALSRPWERSLANNPGYRKLAGKLGTRDLYAWMPNGPEVQGKPDKRFKHGLAFGLSASASGVNTRVLLPRGPLEMAVIQPAGKVAGGELVSLLPADDFLALRLGGDAQALQPVLEAVLPRGFFARLQRAGIDPAKEVLGLLQPGVVVSLGLNPDVDLSGGLPVEASITRTNPFEYVHATVYARVKDPAAAAQVLDKLAAGASHFRMQVETEEVEGGKRYKATYAAGEGMSWTLAGDTLVVTGGKGRLASARERLARRDGAGFAIADESARKVFDASASAAHLDVPRLTAALRAVPESAYGIGGFRIKAVVETWAELLGEVKGVTASFSVDDAGLVVDADLGLQ